MLDLSACTRDQMAAVQELTVETYVERRGEEALRVRRAKLKLHPKREALALIAMGKEIGMFQETPNLDKTVVSPEVAERRRLARERMMALLKEMEAGRFLEYAPAKPNGQDGGG